MGMGEDIRVKIAKRAAQEIKDGHIVNLGIGIPSLVPNFLPKHLNVMIQAENGVLGIGPSPLNGKEDENLCNAAGYPVTSINGTSYFDSSVSFGMIRRGYIDITILGSLQVSKNGDLANWIVPGKRVPGMGGAMELAQKSKKVIVVMSHVDKNGRSKIVANCTLPLTSKNCVDLIITDYAVIKVENGKLILVEVMDSYNIHDVITHTEADLVVSDKFYG
jgi:acetate CoA/acetoacetate CoA-transferase beta subunit